MEWRESLLHYADEQRAWTRRHFAARRMQSFWRAFAAMAVVAARRRAVVAKRTVALERTRRTLRLLRIESSTGARLIAFKLYLQGKYRPAQYLLNNQIPADMPVRVGAVVGVAAVAISNPLLPPVRSPPPRHGPGLPHAHRPPVD